MERLQTIKTWAQSLAYRGRENSSLVGRDEVYREPSNKPIV